MPSPEKLSPLSASPPFNDTTGLPPSFEDAQGNLSITSLWTTQATQEQSCFSQFIHGVEEIIFRQDDVFYWMTNTWKAIIQDRQTSRSVTTRSAFEQSLHACTEVATIDGLDSRAAGVSAGMYQQNGARKILLGASTNVTSQVSVAVRFVPPV